MSLRNWSIALFICAVLVLSCVTFVDRPLALFAHAHIVDTRAFALPLNLVLLFVPLSVLGLLLCGCIALSGQPMPRWAISLTLASVSLVWALTANFFLLQPLFGRVEPDAFLANPGQYGFVPFHGHGGGGFPSGHTTVATSFLLVFWQLYPRARTAIGLVIAATVVGLVLATWHFVSDTIGGAFVGATTAIMTVSLLRAKTSRL